METTRTDQVRRDIEELRGDLGQTLEALGDRVAPGKVAARTKEKVADKVEDVRDRVSPGRAVKRQSRRIGDTLKNLMGGEENDLEGPAPGPSGRSFVGPANEITAAAVGAARSAPRAVQARARGNPLAFGLLTFAGGFLIASVLPPTDRERQVSQRLKDGFQPAVQEAVERGRAVAGELGQSAQQSLEEVKRTATAAAERVKGEAAESAADLKDQTASAAQELKGEAQSAADQLKSKTNEAPETVRAATDDLAPPPPARPTRAASARPRPLRARTPGL